MLKAGLIHGVLRILSTFLETLVRLRKILGVQRVEREIIDDAHSDARKSTVINK